MSMEVTANEAYYAQLPAGTPVVIELAGAFGGATATFGFEGASGAFVAFRRNGTNTADAVTAAALSEVVTVPSSGKVGVSVTGGTDTAAILKVIPVRNPMGRA